MIDEYNNKTDIADLMELEANGMMLSPTRAERTASVAEIPGVNAFIDFGASGQKANGRRDGGDAFELRVRIEARNTGKSIDQVKRDLLAADAKELIKSARAEMESAARAGQRPTQWVIALMSDAGWRQYWKIRKKLGKQQSVENQNMEAQALTEIPAEPSTNERQLTQNGLLPANTRGDLDGDTGREPPPVQAAPTEAMQKLAVIKDYGQTHEWVALVIDGEEIVPAGRFEWLDFVWLSQKKDQQRRAYDYIMEREV